MIGRCGRPIERSIKLAILGCLLALGCDAPISSFEANAIFAKRLEMTGADDLTRPLADTNLALEEMLGVPDQPRWPGSDDLQLVSMERLERAAGAVRSDEEGRHWGLYREHCVVCHGISGDGNGPSAALLNPYPRDFRHGKFKFKSTAIGEKPTRADLVETLRRGIPGTSMPSFALLEAEDVEALVDYVIYLSVRGEVERKALMEAAFELDSDAGERLYVPSEHASDPASFEQQKEFFSELFRDAEDQWSAAEKEDVLEVVPPDGYPIVGEVDNAAPELKESIARGKQLFVGTVAGCSFCHGADAKGGGQQINYDDWTRDWTTSANLNPMDREEIAPMLKLGALKPRHILPRNLTLGVFRGGGKPSDLFKRIVNGIEGTPMPAAPTKPSNPHGLEESEIWDLVNYLLSLQSDGTASGEREDDSRE